MRKFVFDGTKLREWRERRALTQLDLCTAIGMSHWGADMIGKWERRFRSPSKDHLRALAFSLDVPIDALLSTPEEEERNYALFMEWRKKQAIVKEKAEADRAARRERRSLDPKWGELKPSSVWGEHGEG